MKTLSEWEGNGEPFRKFVQEGDVIDKAMYYYFLEIIPPAHQATGDFLMGEPVTLDTENNLVYMHFYRTNNNYYYGGLKTKKQINTC